MGFYNSILSVGTGYLAQDVVAGTGATSSSISYADVFASYSFIAPLTKTYLIHVDIAIEASALDPGSLRCSTFFQLVINGSTTVPLYEGIIDITSTLPVSCGSFRTPVAMTAGSNTIQLQWKVGSIHETATATSGCYRVFSIVG